MFSSAIKWFTSALTGSVGSPIGIDFGTDALRLAQCRYIDGEARLIAAASADVPSHVRQSVSARMAFFSETVRDLLHQGGFMGRKAVLALPAWAMHLQHLRLPRMDEAALKKALPWESRGKLPLDPAHALLRHHVAGDLAHDTDPKLEVILMAAARETVNQYLAAAAKAKLEIVGLNTEPTTLMDCFGHIYRRATDATAVNCFVDIGASATRAIVAQGSHMLFARTIPIGGDHFSRAVAASLKISLEDARLLRIRLCQKQHPSEQARQGIASPAEGHENPVASETDGPVTESEDLSDPSAAPLEQLFAPPSGDLQESPAEAPAAAQAWAGFSGGQRQRLAPSDSHAKAQRQAQQVQEACIAPLERLIEELDLCRRYHESTFPALPVERLIFVGGEARQKGMCQQIAQRLGLAAQVGDPLVRMSRTTTVGIESGLDRRQPQPAWAIAIGLSLGSAPARRNPAL